MDAVLFSLFRTLDELDLARRTIVVVTSDHGESFGESGFFAHNNLTEEVLRVPFIWRAPGLVAAGRRLTNMVGLVDVVPTIVDLLRLELPVYVQGASLGPELTDGDPGAKVGLWRVVFSELMAGRAQTPYPIVAAGGPWTARFPGVGGPGKVFFTGAPGPAGPNVHLLRALRQGARYEETCHRARERIATAPSSRPEAIAPNPYLLRNLQALGYVQ
jgi:hypothetical protein